ncbi:putative Cathepsin B [Blattamonas nauphoetae]|uniref:Cathepsin B n=1 Tax=Blattamonas nauphoetae TaxID=2049346 RepID=A0ABQ9WNL5_9EUKA|nr:putative Cathepsin B [Blattamonas nauphoetae]
MILSIHLTSVLLGWNLKEIANSVNRRNSATWEASERTRFATWTEDEFKAMNTAKHLPYWVKRIDPSIGMNSEIPEEYDAQTAFPKCDSIDYVYDQGHCGSCWAMCAFEVLQDRFCIHSNAEVNVRLSGQDVTNCASRSNGCKGGWHSAAFSYMQNYGVPLDTCVPYVMGECDHPGCSVWPTPPCVKECVAGGGEYDKNKYYGNSSYAIVGTEKAIQAEILKNGPVTGVFTTFADIATYKKGVYTHVTGGNDGLHAIKISGWGVMDVNGQKVKYWKIVNSWNRNFGDNGMLYIKRGTNECGIEKDVYAGMPDLSKVVPGSPRESVRREHLSYFDRK